MKQIWWCCFQYFIHQLKQSLLHSSGKFVRCETFHSKRHLLFCKHPAYSPPHSRSSVTRPLWDLQLLQRSVLWIHAAYSLFTTGLPHSPVFKTRRVISREKGSHAKWFSLPKHWLGKFTFKRTRAMSAQGTGAPSSCRTKLLYADFVPSVKAILTYLLTELSSSWGAVNCAAPQEPTSILWNPKVQSRVHKSPPLVPILSYINPIHSIPPYLSKIHFNIVHPPTS
jgi:hypothetical protein